MNCVGQRLKFIVEEGTAFTAEDGKIIRWSAAGFGQSQVFVSPDGQTKKVLRSDEGRWWDQCKKEADNCFFMEAWFGEYPYSSYGYGFRVCKRTGEIHVEGFETEINPRGMTGQDSFRMDCKNYVPA